MNPILINDREALAKQGDSVLGSVRPSVHQCVLSWLNHLSVQGVWLCVK